MIKAFKIAFLLTFVFNSFIVSAQNKGDFGKYTVIVYNIVGVSDKGKIPAQFPGGKDSLKKFVFRNFNIERKGTCSYPNNIKVKFTVEQNGEITNIEYLKHSAAEAYQETIRFIKSMPKWLPATKNDSLTTSTIVLHFVR